ncbi:MAG TPA: hypothetical protein VMR21_03695 [Vicinamibacteria bacterium]|nr:hypothetical protein [Vicinamibacteria bacterium]
MATTEQDRRDAEQLTLLSVAYYVVAAITLLFALLPLLHLGFGIWILARPETFGMPADGTNAWAGWLMTALGATSMLASVVLAVVLWLTGRSLARRRRHVFCLVVAGLTTVLCIPIGTVLGILTIIVLMRPSLKASFEGAAPRDVQVTG